MLINRYRNLWTKVVAVIGCLLLVSAHLFAGSTGQIRGKITEKGKKTGGELIGATVQVVGTTKGAVADLKGEYLIRNLEPGVYTLKITSSGFTDVTVTGVEVKIDQTTDVNQEMSETVTGIKDTIVVIGKKDIIEKSNVEGKIQLSAKQIANKPVSSVEDILSTQAGVQTNSSGQIFIRGGRRNEVGFILDGVPISDGLGGNSEQLIGQQLASGAIQTIEVIKSGFSPEFGEALSGIVNIRSQVGSKDATQFSLEYNTDDFGSAKLNTYSYNQDRLVAKLSGPDPIITKRLLPALGLNFLSDKEFTYFLYAEVDKSDGSISYNDYNTPETRSSLGEYSLFGFKLPNREKNSYHIQTNFMFRPQPSMRITGSYKFWDRNDLVYLSGQGWDYRYSMSTAPIQTTRQSIYSLEFNYSSEKTSYEAIVSYNNVLTSQKPGDPNNPGHGLNPDQFLLTSEWESFEDRNNNGIYDAPEPIINIYPDTATYGNDLGLPRFTGGETDILDGLTQFGRPVLFNNNGIQDNFQSEAFVDLNGNGVWDRGDVLRDKNGNGQLDDDRLATVRTPTAEPFIDGDSIIGEPFTDLNGNGVYDLNVDGFTISIDPTVNQDLNYDGTYNPPLPSTGSNNWSPGIPYYDRNNNGIFDFANGRRDIGETYTDVNRNGVYDVGGSSTFLTPETYLSSGTLWEDRVQRTARIEVKGTRVIGRHELRGGFNISRKEFSYGQIERPYVKYTGRADNGPYADRGAFRDFYAYDPYDGAVYFLDKLEYGSLVASIGVRWDFFLQDVQDVASNFQRDDQGGLILGDRHKISPRIGFSYPISDKAKVYFNYGHFFQLPTLTNFYQRNTTSADAADVLGDPNLDYQKTIQYSFGVKYAINDNYAIDFQGYFKDEFDKINQISVVRGSVTRSVYGNTDYGRSRGIEITIDKRAGGYVTGNLSYTYAFAFGKASEATETLLNPGDLARTPLDESPLNDDIRHTLQSSIQFFIPNTVKPRLFGLPIPNGWSLVLETIIKSGAPFTPAREYPDLVLDSREDVPNNSLRKPPTAFFDLRFSKEFTLAGLDYSLVLQVENILNTVNIDGVYAETGRADTRQNAGGLVLKGTAYDNDPISYGSGRQIRLGLLMQI